MQRFAAGVILLFSETLSVRNTLNRLDSFWLGAFGGRGQLPVSCPVNPHQSRTATPCGSDRVLHVQHDVSVKGGGEAARVCKQPAVRKLCRSQCKEGRSGIQFQLAFFMKVLAFRIGLITTWREIPPLSSASRTHSTGVMWTEHFKVCVTHDVSQV